MPDQPPVQDLGEAKPGLPDVAWLRKLPPPIVASQARLDKPHQRVTVRNSHEKQTHIVRDRYMQGQLLAPGQSAEVDMLAEDIAYFVRERDPTRLDVLGKPKPLHPVVIEGVTDQAVLLRRVQEYDEKLAREHREAETAKMRAAFVSLMQEAAAPAPDRGGNRR